MPILRYAFSRVTILLLLATILFGCTVESKKARFSERAERYFNAGDYDKAKIEYLNLLRIDPQNATAFYRMGFIWAEEGAPLRAVPFLLKARELAPNNLPNRIKLARVFTSIGQLAEARKEVLTVLQQSPADPDAIMILVETALRPEDIAFTEEQLRKFPQRENISFLLASANLALRKGDAASTESALQRALALDPKSPRVHLAMAIFSLFKKDVSKAGEEFKIAADLAPPRSNEVLKYAEFKTQTGATEEAKAFLTQITRRAPDYVAAWSILAQIAFREKKYDEARTLIENIFSRDPDNMDGRMVEADVRLAKGETKKAIDGLERLDKAYPNVPVIKYRLAQAYLRNNNAGQATVALDKAISLNPSYADAVLLRADLHLRSGEAQPAIFDLVRLLKKQPDLFQAYVFLAEAYRSLGRLDDAAAILQERVKVSPQSSQLHALLGMILRQQNKTAEARKEFERAAELEPNSVLPFEQLIDLDIASKNFDAATQRVHQQLLKTPQSGAAHFMEGKIYAAQGKFDLAEATLLKTIDLDPNSSAAYDLLISTYVARNKIPDALRQLETLLSKKPDDQRALIVSALIYQKMNDFAKARDAYEKLLAVSPNSVQALNNLAYLCAERFNQLDKASELARKAYSLQPGNPATADTLGWILYKQGDYQQAMTLLQASAGKLADNPEIQFHLGMASYMMGQTEVARTAFAKAASTPGDFPGKEAIPRRLALLEPDKTLPIDELEALLKQQPSDLVARLRLGEAYEKQGAYTKSAGAYEEALKLNPKLLSATAKLAQLNAGPLQNKEKALEFAKKARELAPSDPHVTGALGSIAYQAGNFTWAYSLLQESARQLVDDAAILHDFSWAAYSLGKVDEAQQIMQQLLKAAPNSRQSQDAKSFLAMTALDHSPNDLAAAEPEVKTILKNDPAYVPALMAQAAIHVQHGESKSAAGIYAEVLRRLPDFAPAQKYLAALYAEDPDNSSKAYEMAAKARKTLTNDPELDQILGEISYQRKEYARAIQLLQESAQKRPLDAKGLYYLGMSRLQAKQKSQAKETLDRALAAGLQEPFAAEAKRALRESQRK